LNGRLPTPLRHEVCRELLQTVHERRPREFFGTNDEGIAALLNLDFVAVQLELPRNSDSLTIPAHKEPCFLCGHEGALLYQAAEKLSWFVWFIWFVLFIWLIWFLWLVSFNQKTRQTKQTKQTK
jgi:hypothetical protein